MTLNLQTIVGFFALTLLLFSPVSGVYACEKIDPEIMRKLDEKVIVLGEIHGTVEMPEFAGNLFCYFAMNRQPVLLGLEMPEDLQPSINTYLASSGRPADKIALLTESFWKWAGKSGQASTALFQLIEKVRMLKSEGYPALLFVFDSAADHMANRLMPDENWQMGRDFNMAATIAKRQEQYKKYRIIVLTGNLHAKRDRVQGRMAGFLERYAPLVSAKLVSQTDGHSWNCSGKSVETRVCGESVEPAYTANTEAGFDLIIKLKELHASSPAIE